MKFTVKTKGHTDFIDITPQVATFVQKSKIRDGMACVFVRGSTAAITTMEYETGIMADLTALFEKWAPENANYQHHLRWGDHNGAAHMKSAILGTDQCVPVENGKLALGTWQQIVLIDFDERPRTRELIVTCVKS